MTRFDKLFEAKRSQPESVSEAEPEMEKAEVEAIKPIKPDLTQNDELPLTLAKSKDPAYVRTTIYLQKAIHKKLKAAAADEEREMSDIVESLIQEWLDSRV